MLVAVAFDPTVTLGNVIQIGSVIVIAVGAYYAVIGEIRIQLATFRQTLEYHASTLTNHSGRMTQHEDRMERHEEKIGEVAERLQFLMGQAESSGRKRPAS
jgi:hypothetical protein